MNMLSTPLRADGRLVYDSTGEIIASCKDSKVAQAIVAFVNAAAAT